MPPPENSVYFGNLRKAQWVKAPVGGLEASSVGVQDQMDYANGGAFVSQSSGSHREFDMSWPTGQESDFRFLREYRDGDHGNGLLYWVDPMAMDVNALPPHVARPELSGMGWPSLLGAGQEPTLVGAGTPTTNLLTNPSFETTTGAAVNVRTNLFTNPSMENDTTGWGVFAGTAGVANVSRLGPFAPVTVHNPGPVNPGSYFARATWTTASTGPGAVHTNPALTGLVVGQVYTASIYIRTSKIQRMNLKMEFFNSVPTLLSSALGTEVVTVANTWTRISVTGTVPASTTLVSINAQSTAGVSFSNWAVSDTVDIDCALLENSTLLDGYFDGSSNSTNDFTFAWAAVAGSSISYMQGLAVTGTTRNGSPGSTYRSNAQISSDGYSIAVYASALATNLGIMTTITLPAGSYTHILKAWTEPGALVGAAGVNLLQQGTGVASGGSGAAMTTTGQWMEMRASFTVAATTAVTLFAYVSGSNTVNAGKRIWFDDQMIVAGSGYTGPYFDGSTQYADGHSPAWTGAVDASSSVIYDPYPGMPFRAAKYTMSAPTGTVAQRKTVMIIPDTHTLHIGFSGTSANGGVVRVQPILRNGTYPLPQDLTLLDPSGATRLNASFSGATYSAVLIYMTQTATGTATVEIASAKAVYAITGIPPVLTGTHVKGVGHSGLRFSSGPTLAYIYYNEDAGKKYVSAAAKLTEVGSWI